MKSTLKRTLMSATVLGAFLLTGMPPASAQDLSFTFEEGTEFAVCPDFTLRLDIDLAGRQTRTLPNKDGVERTITAGKGDLLTFTNVDTGESVEVPTGGSVQRTTQNPDGTTTVVGSGFNTLLLFPSDTPERGEEVPSTTVYTGTVTYIVSEPDEMGFSTIKVISHRGKTRDICVELSS